MQSHKIPAPKSKGRKLNILVISPQPWGEMLVSKHNYAISLAGMEHHVYFLNPPNRDVSKFKLKKNKVRKNLDIIDHRTNFPTKFRFHFRYIYDLLMKVHISHVIREIGVDFDLIWCFESNLYSSLSWFGGRKKIYHPVDMVSGTYQRKLASSADAVFTVSDVIAEKLKALTQNVRVINHGISSQFESSALNTKKTGIPYKPAKPIRVGYIGNLFIDSLDRKTFSIIIKENKDKEFHIWGSCEVKNASLGVSKKSEVIEFIKLLKNSENVTLHGVADHKTLIKDMNQMDIFLLCYDISKDPNQGSNSHKILEYLSTGKVIVSSSISMYKNHNHELIEMPDTKENTDLPCIFTTVAKKLEFFNNPEKQNKRINFAIKNTYRDHIDEIFRSFKILLK